MTYRQLLGEMCVTGKTAFDAIIKAIDITYLKMAKNQRFVIRFYELPKEPKENGSEENDGQQKLLGEMDIANKKSISQASKKIIELNSRLEASKKLVIRFYRETTNDSS